MAGCVVNGSNAMAALLLVNRWQSKLIMVLSRSSHNHNNKGKWWKLAKIRTC